MKTVNRELKFRVWDGKKFHHPEATKDEANHYLQFGTGGFWLFNEKGEMITASEVGGMCDQFTGLHDKNGNEIYEGDILPMKFDHPQTEGVKYGNEFTLNGVVEYDLPHQAKYKISFPYNKHEIISCEFGWGSMPDLEVIGNIHENPELIEQ